MIIQPGIMLGILLAGWGRAVADGLRWVARGAAGRAALVAGAAVLVLGLGAAGGRVAGASERRGTTALEEIPPETYPRLDRPAPPLDLVDQHGLDVSLSRFKGRPVLVTFAYAHCQTVCPLIVHDVLSARRAAGPRSPAALVVTLDPERDVPKGQERQNGQGARKRHPCLFCLLCLFCPLSISGLAGSSGVDPAGQ